jgi:CHAT domain-containing protein/tetratricopeptide (TPR) repeat protein
MQNDASNLNFRQWSQEWLSAVPQLIAASTTERENWLVARAGQIRFDFFEQLERAVSQLSHADNVRARQSAQLILELTDLTPLNADYHYRAYALYALANVSSDAGDYEPALDLYNQVANLLTAESDRLLHARLQIGKMSTLFFLSRYEEAQTLAQELEQILLNAGLLIEAAKVQGNLGGMYQRLDRYNEAIVAYERAADLAGNGADSLLQAKILFNLALIYAENRNFSAALNVQAQCRSEFEANNLTVMLAMLDGNEGWIKYHQADYVAAVRAYERARNVFQSQNMLNDVRRCDQELADLYLDLNLLQETLQTYDRLIPEYDNTKQRFERAKARVQKAVTLSRLGRTGEALSLFRQAAKLFRLEGNLVWQAQTDLYLGELYARLTNLARARFYLRRAANVFSNLGLERRLLQTRFRLAQLRLGGSTRGLRSELETLLTEAVRLEARELIPSIYYALGLTAGSSDRALDYYSRAIDELNQVRLQLPSEDFKTAFLLDKLDIFEAALALCLNIGKPEQAFNLSEQAKSRVLLDLLAGGLSQSQTPLPAEATALYQRLDELRTELNLLYRQINQVPDERNGRSLAVETTTELLPRLAELEQAYTQTLRQVRLLSQDIPVEVYPATLEQVQSWLDEQTLWLQFAQVQEELIAFIVTGQTLQVVTLGEVRQIEHLQNLLTYQNTKFRYGNDYISRHRTALLRSVQGHLGELYDLLLSPLQAYLAQSNCKELIIVPHGSLHLLPFHALYNRKTARYLLEDYTVSYVPSAGVQQMCRLRSYPRPSQLTALATGVPDEFTRYIAEELTTVADILEGSQILSGSAATLANLRQMCQDFPVLHFATHGVFRHDNPLFSALKMSEEWLTVNDIYNLKLNCWLVTLSACDTGINAVSQGDELLGLVRGFLNAGANSLIVSLWALHDKTAARLMQKFYTNLKGGMSKAQALRQAQLIFLQDEEYRHPYYWASLTLTGERN